MGTDWTPAQRRALEPGGKLVLAGAGSGKTTVLTERYIRLLAPDAPGGPAEPRQIVAITFTRKAAANLQGKVHAELLKREREDPEHRAHWRRQREVMPWARIGTMDSFCTTLLKAYPAEAGVDPDFTVHGAGDDERGERIARHLRRLARERSPHLALLADRMGGRKGIEPLVAGYLREPEIRAAALEAAEAPAEAVRRLDELHDRLRALYDLPEPEEAAQSGHDAYVESLVALGHIAEPLVREEVLQVLDFRDLERLAVRLLEAGGAAARHLRANLRAVLVDEFQDTSRLQWRLVRQLAVDGEGRLDPDRLFLVGDIKQSIYGWRGADVTVVRNARRELAEAFGDDPAAPDEELPWVVDLNDNFRTHPRLLGSLNRAFEGMLGTEEMPTRDDEARASALEPRRSPPEGVATGAEIAVSSVNDPLRLYRWLAQRLRAEADPESPERLQIAERTEDGERLRPLEYTDIGLLLRSRSKQPLLEQALREAGVPFTVVGGRGFLQRQEVLDLHHLLAALADPRDHLALLGALRSPLFNLRDSTITALFGPRREPLTTWKRLLEQGAGEWDVPLGEEERGELARARGLWLELEELAEHAPPAELLLRALEAGGAWAAYAYGERGPQRIANIYQFISLVRDRARQGHFTLRRVVAQIEALRQREDAEADAEADVHGGEGVRVMTIHAAKGLEFPCVVLADLGPGEKRGLKWGDLGRGHLLIAGEPGAELAHPQLAPLGKSLSKEGLDVIHETMRGGSAPKEEHAENLRLLYVGATRVRERLLLLGWRNAKGTFDQDSRLGLWLNALGAAEEDGKNPLVSEPEVEGFVLRELTGADLPDPKERVAAPPPLPSEELPPGEVRDPGVRLVAPPPADRWSLPFTAFAAWVGGDGGEEGVRRLVWYEGNEWDEAAPDEPALPSGREGDVPEPGGGRDFASAVGELLHRAYQRFGPGCPWAEAQGWLEDEAALELDEEALRRGALERLRELVENGRELGLARRAEGAKRELALLLDLDGVVLRGRADLAWREGETAVVADYKTNRLDGADPAEVARAHGYDHQAHLYALALASAWKVERAEARLVFLDGPEEVAFTPGSDELSFYRAKAAALQEQWRELTGRA